MQKEQPLQDAGSEFGRHRGQARTIQTQQQALGQALTRTPIPRSGCLQLRPHLGQGPGDRPRLVIARITRAVTQHRIHHRRRT